MKKSLVARQIFRRVLNVSRLADNLDISHSRFKNRDEKYSDSRLGDINRGIEKRARKTNNAK